MILFFKKIPLLVLLALGLAACQRDDLALAELVEQRSPTTLDCRAVWFRDSLQGVVVGGEAWGHGFILRTNDGGDHWRLDTVVDGILKDVMYDSTGRAYAVGQHGAAYACDAGDTTWTRFRNDFRTHNGCYFTSPQAGVVVSGESWGLGQTRTFGPEYYWWLDTLHDLGNELVSVWATSASTWQVVGVGWVARSADGGHTWLRQPVTDDFFCAVQFATPQVGYICGQQGGLLRSTDGGQNWQFLRHGASSGRRHHAFRSVWFIDARRGWLVGRNGLLWHSTDGGQSWAQSAQVPDNVHFTDIFGFENVAWAVAEGGRIFRLKN
jgi:photosystem II stability/assembly factor-like uncharacterized protein